MSPLEALEAARAAGIQISVEGDDLVLESTAEPPVAVVDLLTEYKADILTILRSGQAVGSAEERAAIAEFEIRANHIGAAPLLASTDTMGAASPALAGSASTGIIFSAATTMAGPTSGGITDSLVIDGSSDITGSASTDTIGSASGDITGSRSGGITGSANSTALLRPAQSWASEDWVAFYDEKAGIAEYDHGLSRQEAEKRAVEHCISEWLSSNQVDSDADDGCVVCGGGDRANDILLAVGLGGAGQAWGQVWLHRECSAAWRASRIAEAVAALAAMGISIPKGSAP